MPKRMSFTKPGGPEVLEWSEFEAPSPKAHEVVVANRVVGLNFIDCYQRSGLYPLPLPGCPGVEGVGTITHVGPEVAGLADGERVIYFSARGAAYAEEICLPAANAIRIPETIDDEIAACLVNKGLTAWYLLRRSYPVAPDDTVVIYAAAGGVGLILTQWARLIGARVIGIVGTPAKAELAAGAGAAETLLADDDVPARVRELTEGRGVPVVYDSVGRDTFFASLDCLAPHGVMVSYGNASGPVEPFALSELARRGSLYVTRPILFDFISDRATFETAVAELLGHLDSGDIRISINQRYRLTDAAEAHRDLEARRTTGCSVLML